MAQPQAKHQHHGAINRGINAILLGAPGSGKGTQVIASSPVKSLPAHKVLLVIAQRNS